MVKLLSNQNVKRSYPEKNRPWAIARLLPNAQTIIVARFHNRQDADDHKRLLHRFIPNAKFEIIFDLPNEQQEEN
jgi:putative acetyltransferase